MDVSRVRAVLFAKDARKLAAFYSGALGMVCLASDDDHARLDCRGFELVVHQIPPPIAEGIVIEQPPKRRTWAATRLDYPVRNLAEGRRLARSLGGGIDDAPPPWAGADATFFLGYDPEGNVFGVSLHP